MKVLCCSLVLAICFAISGCGNGVDEPTSLKKADAETVSKTQAGANGTKAAHGGGLDNDGVVPAKPGEKTGIPGPGGKAGGG